MPIEMQGRRIQVGEKFNPYTQLKEAGDYIGPDKGEYTNGVPAVWFLLPIARDENVPHGARALHHVQGPPHKFTEEEDGSLTIRESIGAVIVDPPSKKLEYYWHGYLTKGRWQLQP